MFSLILSCIRILVIIPCFLAELRWCDLSVRIVATLRSALSSAAPPLRSEFPLPRTLSASASSDGLVLLSHCGSAALRPPPRRRSAVADHDGLNPSCCVRCCSTQRALDCNAAVHRCITPADAIRFLRTEISESDSKQQQGQARSSNGVSAQCAVAGTAHGSLVAECRARSRRSTSSHLSLFGATELRGIAPTRRSACSPDDGQSTRIAVGCHGHRCVRSVACAGGE